MRRVLSKHAHKFQGGGGLYTFPPKSVHSYRERFLTIEFCKCTARTNLVQACMVNRSPFLNECSQIDWHSWASLICISINLCSIIFTTNVFYIMERNGLKLSVRIFRAQMAANLDSPFIASLERYFIIKMCRAPLSVPCEELGSFKQFAFID